MRSRQARVPNAISLPAELYATGAFVCTQRHGWSDHPSSKTKSKGADPDHTSADPRPRSHPRPWRMTMEEDLLVGVVEVSHDDYTADRQHVVPPCAWTDELRARAERHTRHQPKNARSQVCAATNLKPPGCDPKWRVREAECPSLQGRGPKTLVSGAIGSESFGVVPDGGFSADRGGGLFVSFTRSPGSDQM